MLKNPPHPDGLKSSAENTPVGNPDWRRAVEGVLMRSTAFFRAEVLFRKAFVVATLDLAQAAQQRSNNPRWIHEDVLLWNIIDMIMEARMKRLEIVERTPFTRPNANALREWLPLYASSEEVLSEQGSYEVEPNWEERYLLEAVADRPIWRRVVLEVSVAFVESARLIDPKIGFRTSDDEIWTLINRIIAERGFSEFFRPDFECISTNISLLR